MSDIRWFFIKLLSSAIVALGIALIAVSVIEMNKPINYEIIYIDNMPCVSIGDGISCDWSKWQGE